MRRPEISHLLSAGIAAERAGRLEDAKACAEALLHILRKARSARQFDDDGTRAVDLEAKSWAMNVIQGAAGTTPH